MNMLSINLKKILKIKKIFFPFYKRKEISEIFDILEKNYPNKNRIALFVGGCVRKYLEKEEIDDIDIATVLTIDQLKECFKNTKARLIETGIEHGSVTVVNGNAKFEITTLRKDIETDGRHAKIEFTDDWAADSNRRDFTINAIYLDKRGKIFDPQLGQKDLKNKIIKFIGDPERRIQEDYLRILRFIRFSLQYNSEIEKSTIKAIKINLNGIKNLSKERIMMELQKILNLENFYKINNNKDLSEIFLLIFPEFKNLERIKKWKFVENEINQFKEGILAILTISKDSDHEYFCHKYKTSNEIKNNLDDIHKAFLSISDDKNLLKNSIKKNLYFFGKKAIKLAILINFLDSKKASFKDVKNILKKIDKETIPKFPLSGQYLINKGFKEGKNIGEALKKLEENWVTNNFKLDEEKVSLVVNKTIR
jgi:poly(A) polymerase